MGTSGAPHHEGPHVLDSTHSTTRRSAQADPGPQDVASSPSHVAPPPRHGLPHAVISTAVLAAIVVHAVTDGSLLADLVYVGVIIGSAVGAWRVVGLTPPAERLVPRLVAIGLTLTATGDASYRFLRHQGMAPDVSVADLTWWGSYIALCAAVWVVLGRGRTSRRPDLDSVVDVVTILVVGIVVLWRTSIEVVVNDSDLSILTRWVWASYPVADAALLALVVRAMATRRTRAGLSPRFLAGATLWLLADFASLRWGDVAVVDTLNDSAWMLAPVLIASARWRPSPPATHASPEHDRTALQLVLAVVPLIVAPVMEVVADLTGQPDRPDQLIVSTVLLSTLALVRTGRLLRSERRARNEAVEASEAKSVFLANVGHEIRTPLTTVLASAELLEDTDLDDGQRRLLDRMERNGELLKGLVDRILDLSALASGTVFLRPSGVDPRALLADTVATHADRARAQGLELTSYVADGVPDRVVTDRVRVFQVLTNLVDNALKFTESGTVRLELRGHGEGDGDGVCFSVVDTGIGIRTEDHDLVFDLFRQVDGSMTRAYGGTGMGLTICRQLAAALGGTVTLVSSPGTGSTFALHLPATMEP